MELREILRKAYELGGPCRKEDHGKHEDILCNLIADRFEETPCHTRENIQQRKAPEQEFAHKQQNFRRLKRADPMDIDNGGKHKQGADYGDDGADHGDEYRGSTRDAETCRDGI